MLYKLNDTIWIVVLLFVSIPLVGAKAQSYQKPLAVTPAIEREWTNFNLSAVRLKEGSYFKKIMDQNNDYLLQLDPERLLRNVMIAGGLDHHGKPNYGGWQVDAGNGFANYLAAISMAYAATGDHRFKERADWMVDQIAYCQEQADLGGYFYINRVPARDPYHNLMNASNDVQLTNDGGDFLMWNGMAGNAFYQLHRVYAGVRDAYVYADNEKAKEVFLKACDWVCLWTDKVSSDESLQKALQVEHGGIAEILLDAYAFTGDDKYRNAADRWTHKANLVSPLAAGIDVLQGKHANLTDPKYMGLVWGYELTGNALYGSAAVNSWNILNENHTMPNGGHGLAEHYGEPGKFLDHLGYKSTETCCTYNMLKFTRNMFNLYGEVKYLDHYEKALYNHILGSIDPESTNEGGGMCYYTGLLPGMYKEYMDENAFYCCWETGVENHPKYGEAIYFYGDEGLLVNLYIPSALSWAEKGLEMEMTTDFPENDTILFTVNSSGSFFEKLNFRYPEWANDVKLFLNGEEQVLNASPGEIITLDHSVSSGDQIELIVPLKLRLEPSNEPNIAAIFYGPVLLAADLGGLPGGTDVYQSDLWGGGPNGRYNPDADFPFINASKATIDTWLVKKEGEFAFETQGLSNTYTFTPYYSTHHRRFSIYTKIADNDELAQEKGYIADRLIPGDIPSEQAHSYMATGVAPNGWSSNRRFRRPENGGTIAYTLKLSPQEEMRHFLKLTFYGWESDEQGYFEVYADDKLIGEEGSINKLSKYNQWPDLLYEIPEEVAQGKESIRIKIASSEGKKISIYGLSLVTEEYLTSFYPATKGVFGEELGEPFAVRLEAEEAQNKVLRFDADASKASFSAVPDFVRFNNIYIYKEDVYTLGLRYSAYRNTAVNLTINGETHHVVLPATGDNVNDFATFHIDIPLKEGFNSITFTKINQTVSLDYIELNDKHDFENEALEPGPYFARYEAEEAVVNNVNIRSLDKASNGGFVGNIDFNDSYVEFEVVASESGLQNILVSYANGLGNSGSHNISLNGTAVGSIAYPPTGAWGKFEVAEAELNLNKGKNTVRLTKGEGYAELDYMEVVSYQDVVTAVNERHANGFKLYPNPATEAVIMEWESLQGYPWEITLVDMNGRVVYNKTIKETSLYRLNISHLSKGIYILTANNSREMIQKKLVIAQ